MIPSVPVKCPVRMGEHDRRFGVIRYGAENMKSREIQQPTGIDASRL